MILDKVNAEVALEKLHLELQSLDLRTNYTISSQVRNWRKSIKENYSNVANCQFDVYNEDTYYKVAVAIVLEGENRSEEHTSELQSH